MNKSRGYEACTIDLIDSGGNIESITFTFGYEALNEYDIDKSTTHEFRAGNKRSVDHYVKLEWELDMSSIVEPAYEEFINKIKNAKRDGKAVILKPHTDEPLNAYRVLVMNNTQRKLGEYKSPFSYTARHKDYIIWFHNEEAISRHHWLASGSLHMVLGNEVLVVDN